MLAANVIGIIEAATSPPAPVGACPVSKENIIYANVVEITGDTSAFCAVCCTVLYSTVYCNALDSYGIRGGQGMEIIAVAFRRWGGRSHLHLHGNNACLA